MQGQCSVSPCLLRARLARRMCSVYGGHCPTARSGVYGAAVLGTGLRAERLARLIKHEAHSRRRALPVMDTAQNVVALRSSLTRDLVESIDVHPPVRVALFTRHTLASYLDLHVNTIDRLVKRGEMPAYRVSGKLRFYPEDVERYIRDHREVV